jgi:uncharacterized protein (TIGR00159 family)
MWFSFGWWELLDILVVSAIIHRLLLLLRGTAALHVILGLVFLWLLEALARAGGLVLTSWFLRGVGAVAVLVIVVVFRNELRELFSRSNPIRFFLGRDSGVSEIEPVVESAFRLAEERIGALIVLQGRDSLSAYLREGIEWGSKVDSRIIETIFTQQSPFHDGAAIIRGNRITQVGTFLPLTQKEGLPQHYGTRHRAALGLGEVCDAGIVVVSEERGVVSLIRRNRIEAMPDRETLKEALEQALVGTRSKKKVPARRAWLTNVAGLLLTFLLVSTIWGIYVGRQFSLVNVSTAIDFRNMPENALLGGVSTERVEVQVSGNQLLVSSLNREQVRAFLDLEELPPGEHELVLNRENIEAPLGLEVVRVKPSTVKVELEQRIEKSVAVKPKFIGLKVRDVEIQELKVSPDSVRVTGPKSTVLNIDSLFTEQIDLSNIDTAGGDVTIEAPLSTPPPSLRLVSGEPSTVRLRIHFRSKAEHEAPTGRVQFYRVRAGETLWEIGRRHDLTVEQLRQINGLEPETPIQAGQTLILGTPEQD